ncbi:perlucin-like protein isoform X1 [Dreissena polymorpha]|uniref:perlucin-like protein isoform X1 n=1 Tax=Dreissena polymorpha TaxID=45954 RepID=UPI0022645142|nr:perlucin-like protein isoform X1 [Dreissena polymorpha]
MLTRKALGLLFLAAACFSTIHIARSATRCNHGWIPHGQSCYLISHDQEQWNNAESICELFGGYLAEIQNAAEYNFIQSQVNTTQKNFWVGGSDIENEGTWIWMASMTPLSYAKWEAGEPNSDHNRVVRIPLIFNKTIPDTLRNLQTKVCVLLLKHVSACEHTLSSEQVLSSEHALSSENALSSKHVLSS